MTIDELRQRTTLTVMEAAEVYGIRSQSAAYRAVSGGHIPGAVRVGGQWRVSVAPVLEHLGIAGSAENGEGENESP